MQNRKNSRKLRKVTVFRISIELKSIFAALKKSKDNYRRSRTVSHIFCQSGALKIDQYNKKSLIQSTRK